MNNDEVITFMDEKGFTKKEIDKVAYAARKEGFTIEQTVTYLAGEFYRVIFKLACFFILASIFVTINENDLKSNFMLAVIYAMIFIIIFRKYSIKLTFKSYRTIKELKAINLKHH